MYLLLGFLASLATYQPSIHSVRFTAATPVFASPSKDATRIGIVGKDTRARPRRAEDPGNGCDKRWIEIEPRGWACESYLAPSVDEPTDAAAPSLHDDDGDVGVELGVYGAVRRGAISYASRADAEAGENGTTMSGAASVRAAGVAVIDSHRYWITTDGSYIEESSIYQLAPSRFHGVALDDGTVAIGWAHAHDKVSNPVMLRSAPSATAEITGEVAPRTRVAVREISSDGAFVRITDSDWAARADLRVATRVAELPDGVGADDRWFDVDLDEQILVAYQGARPVYATLVSTGRWDRPTPVEVARISSKLRVADMNSTKGDVYAVADVPWTMYYDHNFALHTSYWHDGFGDVRSHGCVNLAPRDARLLYEWSSPDVPVGWIAVYDDASSDGVRGSVVRVHHHSSDHQSSEKPTSPVAVNG